MSDWSLRPSIHSCDVRLVTGGLIASSFYFGFQVVRGCQHRMTSLYLAPEVQGGFWLRPQWGWEGWRSPGLGVASALGLALHRSRAGFDSAPLKNFCRVPFVMPFSVCVCALQKSYSRNYLEFYLALRDYFWLLCKKSQVMPALCRVEGWHRGHESQEDLRRRQCCPPKESCFL